jgi:hypothetical protein
MCKHSLARSGGMPRLPASNEHLMYYHSLEYCCKHKHCAVSTVANWVAPCYLQTPPKEASYKLDDGWHRNYFRLTEFPAIGASSISHNPHPSISTRPAADPQPRSATVTVGCSKPPLQAASPLLQSSTFLAPALTAVCVCTPKLLVLQLLAMTA